MRTIVLTYPGFQSLPKGIKQLLVASESHFFGEATPAVARAITNRPAGEKNRLRTQAENKAVLGPESRIRSDGR